MSLSISKNRGNMSVNMYQYTVPVGVQLLNHLHGDSIQTVYFRNWIHEQQCADAPFDLEKTLYYFMNSCKRFHYKEKNCLLFLSSEYI